jgi:hypothetical protein
VSDNSKLEAALKECRGLLNKLANNNFEQISLQMYELIAQINNEVQLENLSNLVIFQVNLRQMNKYLKTYTIYV